MRQISYLSALVIVTLAICSSAQATTVTFGTGSDEFQIEFMPIGQPGNAADTTGSPNPAGSVAYEFEIGKLEISRQQINRANNVGGLGITYGDLTSFGGNGLQKPATDVSWREAARFVNWLNTSEGYSPAYKFALQPGDVGYTTAHASGNNELWLPSDPGYNPNNLFRNSNALFYLPGLDEWYKAAYYRPDNGAWRDYATGNGIPTAVASGTAAATAVWNAQVGPAIVTEAASPNPYGTLGMTGNVWEILETAADLNNSDPAEQRIRRGGAWNSTDPVTMSATSFLSANVGQENVATGFRVAMVPEPSSIALLGLGAISFAILARRRKAGR